MFLYKLHIKSDAFPFCYYPGAAMSSRRQLYLLVACIPRLKESVESGIVEDDARYRCDLGRRTS